MYSMLITRETRTLPTAPVEQRVGVSVEVIGIAARIIIGSKTIRP